MSEERLKELQEYNLEYLEAQESEEMFGGDYISAVELKYAKKEIERLNDIIKNTAIELEILLESEDFKLITMQLRNIVFRLKGSVNNE